jgi:hypothetical protein
MRSLTELPKAAKASLLHSHTGHDIAPKALLAAIAAVMNDQGKSPTTETSQDFRFGTYRGFVVLELHHFDGENKLNPSPASWAHYPLMPMEDDK